MIYVYLACTEALIPEHYPDVSQYRKERLNAAGSLTARQEGLGAELLLNIALREAVPDYPLPANIVSGENGKPVLRDGSLHFSLSHSSGFAACAVANKPIGLDIQKTGPAREKVLRRVFSESEQNYVMEAPDPDSAFTKLWVMKESVVKHSARGIAELLKKPDVLGLEGLWYGKYGEYHLALYYPCEDGPEVEIKEIALPQV